MGLGLANVAAWPDRSPTWGEVCSVVLLFLSAYIGFAPVSQAAWVAWGGGFVLTLFLLGPVAASAVGQRFGEWFREIGKSGRVACLITFIGVITITVLTGLVPDWMFRDFTSGSILAFVCYLAGWLLWTREVTGWWPAREPS